LKRGEAGGRLGNGHSDAKPFRKWGNVKAKEFGNQKGRAWGKNGEVCNFKKKKKKVPTKKRTLAKSACHRTKHESTLKS